MDDHDKLIFGIFMNIGAIIGSGILLTACSKQANIIWTVISEDNWSNFDLNTLAVVVIILALFIWTNIVVHLTCLRFNNRG